MILLNSLGLSSQRSRTFSGLLSQSGNGIFGGVTVRLFQGRGRGLFEGLAGEDDLEGTKVEECVVVTATACVGDSRRVKDDWQESL